MKMEKEGRIKSAGEGRYTNTQTNLGGKTKK